jgi:hypothetical protein
VTTIPAGLLEGPARAVFYDIVRFYKVKPHALLRSILEMALDAASEEGPWQMHLAQAAQQFEQDGKVGGRQTD